MSAWSFVCLANWTSAMEVWGGEKVHPGTTDSEPLYKVEGRTNY